MFEVWCEKRKLLGNLDMAEAIASFLHLAFVFDLKYPSVSFQFSYIAILNIVFVSRGLRHWLTSYRGKLQDMEIIQVCFVCVFHG